MKDIAVPVSVMFLDALGRQLPYKASFTYKELSDFCQREGVNFLAGRETLDEPTLLRVAGFVQKMSGGNVTIQAGPTTGGERSPLAAEDVRMAEHVVAATHHEVKKNPDIDARVFLRGGIAGHIIEKTAKNYIVIDDEFNTHDDVTRDDIIAYHNLNDPLPKEAIGECPMCGDELWFGGCRNCKYGAV